MFDNLSDKLDKALHVLKGHGSITEVNVAETLKEVRRALLDADVNFKIAKDFTKTVKQKALGQNVLTSLQPSQLMVKIVKDELTALMGGDASGINLKGSPSVILMSGLQGSGKTTFIDILIGLILNRKGSLKIDGKEINEDNVKSYQKNFGYIPQNFYLFDNSIRQNIAINEHNLNAPDINEDKIILKILQNLKLKEILGKKGLDTQVGENAIRLSGGQRQRLGIARILYHNKEILLLDEATNALDKQTEKEIFDLIYSLREKKTIIISTHSVEMLNNCDEVYEIKNNNLNKIK